MRILVTGSTSMQAVSLSHKRAVNFAGLVVEELRAGGHDVDWLEPMVGMPLAGYDHVFVGIAPPLAMGALRAYGALDVVGSLWDSGRLTLFIDAPDPGLITRGLRSVLGRWEGFTKPFFSNRAWWNEAREPETNARLRRACELLSEDLWPRTIVPGLPWGDEKTVEGSLPPGALGRVQAVNLDHRVLSRFEQRRPDMPRLREWAYEKDSDQKWLASQHLALPTRELPRNHRVVTDPLAAQQLRESVGLLAGPVKGEIWWTPRIAMSLASGTPVFTDWYRSMLLGDAWAGLPGPHESYDAQGSAQLAAQQLETYKNAIPGPNEALHHLTRAAGIGAPDRKAVTS